jgi:hypothetical protein
VTASTARPDFRYLHARRAPAYPRHGSRFPLHTQGARGGHVCSAGAARQRFPRSLPWPCPCCPAPLACRCCFLFHIPWPLGSRHPLLLSYFVCFVSPASLQPALRTLPRLSGWDGDETYEKRRRGSAVDRRGYPRGIHSRRRIHTATDN